MLWGARITVPTPSTHPFFALVSDLHPWPVSFQGTLRGCGLGPRCSGGWTASTRAGTLLLLPRAWESP